MTLNCSENITFSKTIEHFIEDLSNMKNIIINQKFKECQISQSTLHHEHRIEHNISDLQKVFRQLMSIIEKLNIIIESRIFQVNHEEKKFFVHYRSVLKSIKEQLIASSFVIAEQPPQVMKTNTNFTVSIRWILGEQFYNNVAHTHIACYILSGMYLMRSLSFNILLIF